MEQEMKTYRYTKRIVIGVLVIAVIALVIFLFPKKITHYVSLDSIVVVYTVKDDYTNKFCDVLNENDLSQLFKDIRCFRTERISFIYPGDICIQYGFYGGYCLVISPDKAHMYSMTTGATYVFLGNNKELYQKVSALIKVND